MNHQLLIEYHIRFVVDAVFSLYVVCILSWVIEFWSHPVPTLGSHFERTHFEQLKWGQLLAANSSFRIRSQSGFLKNSSIQIKFLLMNFPEICLAHTPEICKIWLIFWRVFCITFLWKYCSCWGFFLLNSKNVKNIWMNRFWEYGCKSCFKILW